MKKINIILNKELNGICNDLIDVYQRMVILKNLVVVKKISVKYFDDALVRVGQALNYVNYATTNMKENG